MYRELAQAATGQQKSTSKHIFYYSHKLEKYIENAVVFIEQGIHEGDQVLFVENTRVYPMIRSKLEERLTAEEMKKVHYANNFEFYWKNGNFHPPTILAHFEAFIDGLQQASGRIRTWGHIEWGSEQDIEHDIETYETALEVLVPETGAISVCAYDASRLGDDFKSRLMALHSFYMTDEKMTALTEKKDV